MAEITLRDYFAAHASDEDIEQHMPKTLGEEASLLVKLGWIEPYLPNDLVPVLNRADKDGHIKRLRAWARYQHADAMLAARAKPAAADTHRALIAELVAKLDEARKAIASLDKWALGGATIEHTDGSGVTSQYPIRDELLANIDAALAKAEGRS